MTHPNPATALARVVVDELAHRGVRLIVISPGSRSGALAIAASTHPEIDTTVVVDERSAAFHALGAARAGGRPAAVVATSGSAPTHFFPAIVEADMSCVPLIAVSADRPAELHGIGSNQTIDQQNLFGAKVRSFAVIEAPGAEVDRNVEWRGIVARLVAASTGDAPGPVHLNVAFREPTVPVTDDGRTQGVEYAFPTPRISPVGLPVVDGPSVDIPRFQGDRGVVIAGDGDYDRSSVIARAREIGWPVLATALSGMRGDDVVTTYHHLLPGEIPAAMRPKTVVAVGAIGPSLHLENLVAAAENRVRVDRWGRSIDPGRNATHVLAGDVVTLLGGVESRADDDWAALWAAAERECRERVDLVLAESGAMSGAAVASSLNHIAWADLVVASSLPIRDVDAHLRRGGRVFANRGASGIDGFVSTALGVASQRARTLAVTGDLSLLHDANGFINDGTFDLTIVLIDNHGGGLFDSLPQARHAPGYERLFVTPPNRDFATFADFHGLRYGEADDPTLLEMLADQALDRPGIDLIRVEVDRAHDGGVRAQLDG